MLRGKKLGLLLSARPDHPNFTQGLRLAEAALKEGVDVYLYCLDDAVTGIEQPLLQELKECGLKLFACAYGSQRRDLPLSDKATFSGLTMLSEIIACADRFVSFN